MEISNSQIEVFAKQLKNSNSIQGKNVDGRFSGPENGDGKLIIENKLGNWMITARILTKEILNMPLNQANIVYKYDFVKIENNIFFYPNSPPELLEIMGFTALLTKNKSLIPHFGSNGVHKFTIVAPTGMEYYKKIQHNTKQDTKESFLAFIKNQKAFKALSMCTPGIPTFNLPRESIPVYFPKHSSFSSIESNDCENELIQSVYDLDKRIKEYENMLESPKGHFTQELMDLKKTQARCKQNEQKITEIKNMEAAISAFVTQNTPEEGLSSLLIPSLSTENAIEKIDFLIRQIESTSQFPSKN